MAVPTPAEIVEKIDTAIGELVTGQAEEVEVNGKRFKSHNLSTLRDLRKFYSDLADQGSNPLGFAAFAGRSARG